MSNGNCPVGPTVFLLIESRAPTAEKPGYQCPHISPDVNWISQCARSLAAYLVGNPHIQESHYHRPSDTNMTLQVIYGRGWDPTDGKEKHIWADITLAADRAHPKTPFYVLLQKWVILSPENGPFVNEPEVTLIDVSRKKEDVQQTFGRLVHDLGDGAEVSEISPRLHMATLMVRRGSRHDIQHRWWEIVEAKVDLPTQEDGFIPGLTGYEDYAMV
ncbi:uncharacterized protein BDR25DRAFT_364264 [Lindgomyces ingoldianus]|uniref:Uncharacterized protein n=1 Tax=Lindgomyces ingoldianus TaxID=673940 RepID=A0ACB6RDP3_9PLEO|nr:uncharacterized protein BDR25DRAFT_364264 [Lindgomyces ingoldianus]KAF2477454.1 hypothetical protein BDR25DRAFT_364264 [Lindgomyces ingoldianus]